MDIKRIKMILYIVAVFLAVMLFMKWQLLHAPKPTPQQQTQTQKAVGSNTSSSSAYVPNFAAPTSSAATTKTGTTEASVPRANAGHYISIKTKVLDLKVDLTGGKVIEAQLLKYPNKLHSKTPFTLLSDKADQHYFAQSGFTSKQISAKPLKFRAAKSTYDIANAANMAVTLYWKSKDGIQVEKTFSFTPDSYTVGVSEKIMNGSGKAISGRFYGQLIRQPEAKNSKLSMLTSHYTYTGGAVSSQNDHYQKVTFKDMTEQNLNISTTGGWASMVQHYFISAWIPTAKQTNQIYSRVYGNTYGIGVAYPETRIVAGGAYHANAQLYVGPAIAHSLNALAPYLGKTVDYGWLWFISDIVFAVMSWIYSLIGNWGWSIILVTLLIKLIFYPLSAKSYRSMAKMRMLAPKIKQLKERLGGDRQAMGKATMELYRKEKVNPLGGCLPMVIQIPVFFALYWVLIESIQLRQAPFIFWIHNLSVRDPYFILPVLMGISMFVQQKLNPAPADPTQAKVMMFLPVIFTVMFAFFPAGLVLYWLTNNLISISQQWWVMRKVTRQAAVKKR